MDLLGTVDVSETLQIMDNITLDGAAMKDVQKKAEEFSFLQDEEARYRSTAYPELEPPPYSTTDWIKSFYEFESMPSTIDFDVTEIIPAASGGFYELETFYLTTESTSAATKSSRFGKRFLLVF